MDTVRVTRQVQCLKELLGKNTISSVLQEPLFYSQCTEAQLQRKALMGFLKFMQGWTSLVLKEDAAPSQCNSGIQKKDIPSLCLVLTSSLQHSPSVSASHLRAMNGHDSSVLVICMCR